MNPLMTPILGFGLFVLLTGLAILWIGRQARIVREELEAAGEKSGD